jgi:hypothetical protein
MADARDYTEHHSYDNDTPAIPTPYKCQGCDWAGISPTQHESVHHDGAQTCWPV